MKKSVVTLVFVGTLCLCGATVASSQCVPIFTAAHNPIVAPMPKTADYPAVPVPKPDNYPADNVEVTIADGRDSTFLVAIDNDADSGYNRINDLIPMTVVKPLVVIVPVDAQMKYRCTVIPLGAKVWGIVDHARTRSIFALAGKARLRIFVDKFELDDGRSFTIDFVNPTNLLTEAGVDSSQEKNKILEQCKNNKGKTCVIGRRTKPAIPTAIIGAGASNGVTVIKDSPADSIAILGLIKDLANTTGVSDLVNQNNALVKSKTVYMVVVKHGDKVWMPVKAAEPAKPADKSDK